MAPSNARFVVHMDILGMSHLVRLDPELAWQALGALVEARNHVGVKTRLIMYSFDE